MVGKITQVDTTPEGHLYLVVDYGDGWVEDHIFPDLRATDDWLRIVRWAIDHHGTKGLSGNRCDPNIVLGGPDPRGLKRLVGIFAENGIL
jgi:hypothetical protein